MTNYPKCRICGQMTKDYYSKQCSACYWSRGRQNFYCSKCKSLISATSANFGGGLCRKCADKQHSLRMMGKNNPNWKDVMAGQPVIEKLLLDILNRYETKENSNVQKEA
jgi:hypothetical protein